MQGNKRTRGRGRKSSNQVNKTLDSNGPDVKIRGTASHIYEKYQSLARDANSSGDKVAAENYLQHAEHYFRLMAAAQANNQQQQQQHQQQQQQHANGAANGADEQPPLTKSDLNGHNENSSAAVNGPQPQPDAGAGGGGRAGPARPQTR